VAFLRAFIYGSEVSPDIKDWYIGVVKSQKKRLLAFLASHNYEDYINELLINRIATKKEVAAIREKESGLCRTPRDHAQVAGRFPFAQLCNEITSHRRAELSASNIVFGSKNNKIFRKT
jgi:hypothetical protein